MLRSLIKYIFYVLFSILFLTSSIYSSAKASIANQNLINSSKQIVIDNLKQELTNYKVNNPDSEIFSEENFLNYRPTLYVFVSTSMPESLIKNYYNESSNYGAVMVFKGLPNGSFKALIELIQKFQHQKSDLPAPNIDGNYKLAGSIIDDELFNKYGVDKVPTIALVNEEECFEFSSCRQTYDIIKGNIGIKGALEEFVESGDLKDEALLLLNKKRDW